MTLKKSSGQNLKKKKKKSNISSSNQRKFREKGHPNSNFLSSSLENFWYEVLLYYLKQLTLPPLLPRPLLLNLSTLREKQEGLISSAVTALTPSGPNALSLRSSSVRWASAFITPSPKAVWRTLCRFEVSIMAVNKFAMIQGKHLILDFCLVSMTWHLIHGDF